MCIAIPGLLMMGAMTQEALPLLPCEVLISSSIGTWCWEGQGIGFVCLLPATLVSLAGISRKVVEAVTSAFTDSTATRNLGFDWSTLPYGDLTARMLLLSSSKAPLQRVEKVEQATGIVVGRQGNLLTIKPIVTLGRKSRVRASFFASGRDPFLRAD